MPRLRIAVDYDDTTVDTTPGGFLPYFNAKYGTNFTPEHLTNYGFHDCFPGFNHAEIEAEHQEYVKRQGHRLQPKIGSVSVLQILNQRGHELIILTARDYALADMTSEHAIQHFGSVFTNQIFGATDKATFCKNENIDIMIEDAPHHIEAISRHTMTLVMNHAWNSHIQEGPRIKRIERWSNVLRYAR